MTTESMFWSVIIAGSGGLFVLVGLLMELEWEEYKKISNVLRSKSRKVWGEWLVIFGIVIEICLAGFAAKDEWQTREIAIKNDPSKRPIVLATATATLSIGPTNNPPRHLRSQMLFFGHDSDPPPNFPWDTKQVFVELILTNLTTRLPQMIILRCSNSKISDSMIINGQSRFIITLTFEINSMENLVRKLEANQMFPRGTVFPPDSTFSVQNFDENGQAVVYLKSQFPDGFEIKAGTCSILFNSTIERSFDVPEHVRDGLVFLNKSLNNN